MRLLNGLTLMLIWMVVSSSSGTWSQAAGGRQAPIDAARGPTAQLDLLSYYPIGPEFGYRMAMLLSNSEIHSCWKDYLAPDKNGVVASEERGGDLITTSYYLVRPTGIYMAGEKTSLKEDSTCRFMPAKASVGDKWRFKAGIETYEGCVIAKMTEFSKVQGDFVRIRLTLVAGEMNSWIEYTLSRGLGPVFIQYHLSSKDSRTTVVGLAARQEFLREHFLQALRIN